MPETDCRIGLISRLGSRRVILPLKAMQCEFVVQGGLAEVCLVQVYHQENDHPLDCRFLFPLPADASVYCCEAQINERRIQARVEERHVAVKLARDKKRAGHRTTLVESERENLFTLSLANLQSQDLVEIRLAYVQPLRRLADQFALEIPFNPGIRYIPGQSLLRSNVGKGVVDDTDQVPDASRITPPRIDQFHPDAAFICVAGKVEAQFADPSSFTSPRHLIEVLSAEDYVRVELASHGDIPGRDFVLRWKEKQGQTVAPRAWICRKGDEEYALLEIRAPRQIEEAEATAQDIHFLVDRSGSMAGEKWNKAVAALQSCVAVLGPEDRAMITLFESSFKDFAEKPLPSSQLLGDAEFHALAELGTDGGTEMGPALSHVLDNVRRYSRGRRANLVLITDAQVGNDLEILQIMEKAPELPVHAFGIDNALNDALLQGLCRQQGGTFHSMNPKDDVVGAVTLLGRTLRQPVLLDLSLPESWELADNRLPDLYAGQIHYAAARSLGHAPLEVRARNTGGQVVSLRFEAEITRHSRPWLQWCKSRIQHLLRQDPQSVAAVQLSKDAGIICPLTAFVAWDEAEKVAVADHELIQPAFDLGVDFERVGILTTARPFCHDDVVYERDDFDAPLQSSEPVMHDPEVRSAQADAEPEDQVGDSDRRAQVDRLLRLSARLSPAIGSAGNLKRYAGALSRARWTSALASRLGAAMDELEKLADEWERFQKEKQRVLSECRVRLERATEAITAARNLLNVESFDENQASEFDEAVDEAGQELGLASLSRLLGNERKLAETLHVAVGRLEGAIASARSATLA